MKSHRFSHVFSVIKVCYKIFTTLVIYMVNSISREQSLFLVAKILPEQERMKQFRESQSTL